jgi:hypothetical protein
MRFVDTAEGPADPISEFVCAEQPLGLDHLSLAVDPFRLYRIEPRTLLGKQAGHYAHSAATIFDLAVVGCHPVTHLMAFMPAGVVPDQKQGLLLPLCSSFSQHHPRNCVVMALTGLPSTNLSQVCSSSGTYIP